MPLYPFKCPGCGRIEDMVKKVDERDVDELCRDCGQKMERQLTTDKTKPFTPYFHVALDRFFTSRSEERSYAKKSGLVDISSEYRAQKKGGKLLGRFSKWA